MLQTYEICKDDYRAQFRLRIYYVKYPLQISGFFLKMTGTKKVYTNCPVKSFMKICPAVLQLLHEDV
jgi:hypothetical protein